ncbi:hypothetical protein MLD38_004827 [Melastoma candidum]|uniref:Uncharacterized protein n=1 Tax=Melastoma candidum TaxID=119954 RepID=A0ACB9S728_9MYRT|nr:hypothetical protein MLD38_004827 [Melastoma candidum]
MRPRPITFEPQQEQQSLASHFDLLNLIEKLADAIENGARDQHFDALVSELTSQFEKCQQLLNTIAGSLSSKNVTVESQKCKLEETEQLLNQQRELMSSYRKSLEGLIRPEP